jgi:hypothetical protein
MFAFAAREETPALLVAAAIACIGGGVALLLLYAPLGIALMVLGMVPAALFLVVRKARRRMSIQALLRAILGHLRRSGVRRFRLCDVDGIQDVPDTMRDTAVAEAYALYYGAAVKDAQVSARESEELNALAAGLGLATEAKKRIELRCARGVYSDLLAGVLSDGTLTSDEARMLRDARAQLRIPDEQAVNATMPQVRDAYLALFRRFAQDGTITDQELELLERFRIATGLSFVQAGSITAADAANLFTRTVSMLCQSAGVRPTDRCKLVKLAEALAVPVDVAERGLGQADRALMLAEIRRGRLPSVEAPLLLRSTEISHYISNCTHVYNTRTRTVSVRGRVVVTGTRVIFEGERSFEFRISRVINIHPYTNAVDLLVSGGRGQGRYYVDDGPLLAAVLDALVRAYNRFVVEGFDDVRSRQIPDDVKVAVWRRDGGRCVRCQEQNYLEYDHIIPFSKGGANSVNNVQLLCRRCNLAKSDELV